MYLGRLRGGQGAAWLSSRSSRGVVQFQSVGRCALRTWASAEGLPDWYNFGGGPLVRRRRLAGRYTEHTQRRRWPSLDALRSGSPMAEPRAAPAAEVVVYGRDVLLA